MTMSMRPMLPRASSGAPTTAVQAGPAVWGIVLVVAPGAVLRRCDPAPPRPVEVGARLLGLRHIVQAAWVTRAGTSEARRRGVLVDAAHLSTMVGLAAVSRRYRCPATLSLRASGI